MNHPIRQHRYYKQAQSYLKKALASQALMLGFEVRIRDYYEQLYGPNVEVPPLDMIARVLVPGIDLNAEKPSAEQRVKIRKVADQHPGMQETIFAYAQWMEVGQRVLDERYAKQFKEKGPKRNALQELDMLLPVCETSSQPSPNEMLEIFDKAATRALTFLDATLQQSEEASPVPRSSGHYDMSVWAQPKEDAKLRKAMHRVLVDDEASLYHQWNNEVVGESRRITETGTDVLSLANDALIGQSAEFGRYYHVIGSKGWGKEKNEMPDTNSYIAYRVARLKKLLPEHVMQKAASVVILKHASVAFTEIGQSLLERVEYKQRLTPEDLAQLSRDFDVRVKEPMYQMDPIDPPKDHPGKPNYHAVIDGIGLIPWLKHLGSSQVKDIVMSTELDKQIDQMHNGSREAFLKYCEEKVNGRRSDREIR